MECRPDHVTIKSGTDVRRSGTGAGAISWPAATNTLTNFGTLTALVRLRDQGREKLHWEIGTTPSKFRHGIGNVFSAAGATFNNMAGGVFNSGATSISARAYADNAARCRRAAPGDPDHGLTGNLVQSGPRLLTTSYPGATSTDQCLRHGQSRGAGAIEVQNLALVVAAACCRPGAPQHD